MEVFIEGKGVFVHWVGTRFPKEVIQIHTVLSGKFMSLRIDDEALFSGPEQEPKEKAIEEIRLL